MHVRRELPWRPQGNRRVIKGGAVVKMASTEASVVGAIGRPEPRGGAAPRAARDGAPSARRRTLVAGAAGFTSVLAIAGAQIAALTIRGDAAPHGAHGATTAHAAGAHAAAGGHGAAATATRRVGDPQSAKLDSGGRAVLTIRAEAPVDGA